MVHIWVINDKFIYCDEIIIPLQAQFFSDARFGKLVEVVEKIKAG
jgi:hypothetical protein